MPHSGPFLGISLLAPSSSYKRYIKKKKIEKRKGAGDRRREEGEGKERGGGKEESFMIGFLRAAQGKKKPGVRRSVKEGKGKGWDRG